MKRLLTLTALAVFGLAPAIGGACEVYDDTSASAAPPAQLGSAPAATKVPAPTLAKALTPKVVKPAAGTAKAPVSDQKLAATSNN